MPQFAMNRTCRAPLEEVWKLLHDPARFPQWWDGVETVRTDTGGRYTMWPLGYPDFPMSQRVDEQVTSNAVTISCLVSDLVFRWQLQETIDDGTLISVEVEIPEAEARRLDDQRAGIERSLLALAALAEAGSDTAASRS
jgi:uncharacterized protein YndB with AHSA1/START domain